MDSAVRSMRIIHAALVLAAVLYIYIPEKVDPQHKPCNHGMLVMSITLAILCAMLVAIMFFVRNRYVSRSEETLRVNSNDVTAGQRWRQGQIITMALCESVVLYGLVLRFTTGSRLIAAPFYTVGLVLLLVLMPRRP